MSTTVAEFGIPEPACYNSRRAVVFAVGRTVITRRMIQKGLDLLSCQASQDRDSGYRRLLSPDAKLLFGDVDIDLLNEVLQRSGRLSIAEEHANERNEKPACGC